MPPSTRKVLAVMKLDSSEARKSTALAISSGSANRPSGMCTSRRAARSGIVGEQFLQQGGVHRSGAQGVDPHALAGELDAQFAAHASTPPLEAE